MAGMKSLAKDTAIYGLSSILGRFLNWCFVFLYINVLKTTAEYGIVTNLYAYMALLLIILTYGMETGFFRFANDKEEKEPQRAYFAGDYIDVVFCSCVGVYNTSVEVVGLSRT